MQSKVMKMMRATVVKKFFDLLVLTGLKEKGRMGGYDVISFIHEKFHVLISSGTVYTRLYSLERDGWVKGTEKDGKRVYELTSKGEEAVVAIVDDSKVVLDYLANVA